jgi:DDE superfamily endonuclease
MLQDTTPAAAPKTLPPLLVELWRLRAAHRPAVRQARCFDRLRALVVGHLCTAARHTITQVLLTLGLVDADWSAFYRLFSVPRLDYGLLTQCFLQATLAQIPPQGPYVAVVDGVQLPRSSKRMPGTSWLKNPRTPVWKPGIHRAQRCVHLATLLPRWQGYSRARLPLSTTHYRVALCPSLPDAAVPSASRRTNV